VKDNGEPLQTIDGVRGSVDERRDLVGWNASLGMSFLALVVWAVIASVNFTTAWSFWIGVFLLGAGIFRGVFTAFTSRRPAFLWSAFGAFVFALVGLYQVFSFPALRVTIFLVSFAILIDVFAGAYLASKYVDSKIRSWILILAPIHLLPGYLVYLYSPIGNEPLYLSFILVLALSVHSVAAFSLFLHMKKRATHSQTLLRL